MPNNIEALKSRFTSALRDGRVSAREAEGLIALARDGGGVTQSERRHVREMFVVHGDKFESTAKARMDGFIKNEIPALLIDDNVVVDGDGRRDLADPTVANDDASKLQYSWVEGSLFVDGAQAGDVVQGYIGDCYMVAAFSSVAAQSPEVIENAIKDNGDGTFSVRFYETSWSGNARPVDITVDGQLPTNRGGLYYGKNKEKGELWVGLLEKAYAQWKGGYEAIGQGGSAGDVMAALTGRRDDYVWLSTSSDHQETFDQITAELAAGKSVAAGTHGSSREEMYKGTGVYANHAYSILGTEEQDGTKYVVLRNPWGEVEPSGNGPDDGVFKLDMATFLKLYSSLYVA